MKHAKSLVILGLLTVASFAQQKQPNTTNQLHMLSKPAVVRILSGYVGRWVFKDRQFDTMQVGSGSGFIINPNGYIVTNAHVVDDIKQGDDAGKRTLLQNLAVQVLQAIGQPVNESTVSEAMEALGQEAQLVEFKRINYVFLQSGSKYPFEIKSFGAPIGAGKDLTTGKDVAVLKIEIKNAPTLKLGNSEQTQVGDQIWVIGYPGAADSEALDAKSQLEPTTNDGKISAKKTSTDGAPILQTNTSTTHGNSGGPAINEKGEVIGILTFRGNTVNGQEVQGFNFLVPINTASEFVRQAGTEYAASPIDKLWRTGLDHYWKSEFTKAKESFQGVTALFTDHSEATRLITEAQERIAKGEDKSSGWNFSVEGPLALLIIGGILVVPLCGIIGLVWFLHSRSKRRHAPTPTSQPLPTPRQPMSAPQPVPATTVPSFAPKTESFAPVRATEVFSAPTIVAPVKVPQAKLVFTAGPLKGQEFSVKDNVTLGRDQARAQIVIAETQVSGQHLWLGFANGKFIARDNNSTNGTYLNHEMNHRISEAELKDGDTLTLGSNCNVELTVKL
ncbi:MAG: trypsin-like peptidase domain-containing protein [Acidobacteria bacterium]|nr:trypsin-like peptidase domain-containing protein [Acidobacteriota bacterium]